MAVTRNWQAPHVVLRNAQFHISSQPVDPYSIMMAVLLHPDLAALMKMKLEDLQERVPAEATSTSPQAEKDLAEERVLIGELAAKFKNILKSQSTAHRQKRGAFELFPNLPLEIRLKIWREAIQETGLMVLAIEYTFTESLTSPDWKRVGQVFCDKIAPPIVIQVCQESRREILEKYRPVVSCQIRFNQRWRFIGSDGEYIKKSVPDATKIPRDEVIEKGLEFQNHHPAWLQPWVVLEFFEKVKGRDAMSNHFWIGRKDEYWRCDSSLQEMPKTAGEVYGGTSAKGKVTDPNQRDHIEPEREIF